MGVPIDRGLTQNCAIYIGHSNAYIVEMGVPIDRGLTPFASRALAAALTVEMGVPIDRGLTHNKC